MPRLAPALRACGAALALLCLLCGALPANAQACPLHCNCDGDVPVCLGEFARNPPKNAIIISPLNTYCKAAALHLLSLGSKRCSTLEGRVADCMRQKLDPKTSKRTCNYPPSVERIKCKCPSKKDLCATLPKLTTQPFGKFIPSEVFSIMGCTKPAQTGLRTSPMLGSSSTCSSWAPQLNAIIRPVLTKFWPTVQGAVPEKIDLSSIGMKIKGQDLGFATLDLDVGLQSLTGLKGLALPTVAIADVTSCANLSSIQAKVTLSSSLPQIKVTGAANVVLNIPNIGALPVDATVEITAPVAAKLNASINAGIMTNNPGTAQETLRYCAAVESIDAASLSLGALQIKVFLLGQQQKILDGVTELVSNLVVGLMAKPDVSSMIDEQLRIVMNDSLLQYMGTCADIFRRKKLF